MADVPVPLTVFRSNGAPGATDMTGRKQPNGQRRFVPPITVRWIVNAIYAALLVALAVVPPSPWPGASSVPDWLAHGVAYGVQAALLFWAVPGTATTRSRTLAALTGAIVFGAVTEALQLLQPARSTELIDVVADAVGAAISLLLILIVTTAAVRAGR